MSKSAKSKQTLKWVLAGLPLGAFFLQDCFYLGG